MSHLTEAHAHAPAAPAAPSAPAALVRALVAGALVALALAPQSPLAQPRGGGEARMDVLVRATGEAFDDGRLIISQHGKPVRVEEFAFQRLPDTLLVRAASRVARPGEPPGPIDKSMILVVGPLDYAMGSYWSQMAVGPDTLRRGIEVTPGDTAMSVWREFNGRGVGDRLVAPPGRMYVIDPPLFTPFGFLGRTLQGKVCDHRPISVMVLGARDSLVDATVDDAGSETIRWGGRPVVTRKLVIADRHTTFTAWIAADGRLMRIEQPDAGLRIEREAPPLKHRTPRTK